MNRAIAPEYKLQKWYNSEFVPLLEKNQLQLNLSSLQSGGGTLLEHSIAQKISSRPELSGTVCGQAAKSTQKNLILDFNSGVTQTHTPLLCKQPVCWVLSGSTHVAKGIRKAEGFLVQCPPLNARLTTGEAQQKREDH